MKIIGSSLFFAAGAAAVLEAASVSGAAALPAARQTPQQAAPAEPQAVTVLFRALLADGRPFADVRLEDVELKVDGRGADAGLASVRAAGQRGNRQRAGGGSSAVCHEPPRGCAAGHHPRRRGRVDRREHGAGRPGRGPAVGQPSCAPGSRRRGDHSARRRERRPDHRPREDPGGHLGIERAGCADGKRRGRRVPYRQVLDALMNVFRGAAGSPPATVIVFGGGLTPPMFDDVTRMSNPVGLCDIRAKDYQEAELVMLGSPVSVNVIHVPDPTGSGAAASTSQVQGLDG